MDLSLDRRTRTTECEFSIVSMRRRFGGAHAQNGKLVLVFILVL